MSDALLQNAWRLHQEGKLLEAANLYADILRANPRNFDALYQLAMIYLASRKFADAERLFAVAVQINSQSPDLFTIADARCRDWAGTMMRWPHSPMRCDEARFSRKRATIAESRCSH